MINEPRVHPVDDGDEETDYTEGDYHPRESNTRQRVLDSGLLPEVQRVGCLVFYAPRA